MTQPVFVLTRPQMGENIGAAARAMLNFELDQMRIVDPRDGWPNSRAVAMASGAGRVLDQAQIFDDFPGAIADRHFVMATTARARGLTKPVLAPEEAMRLAAEKISDGQRVAVVFGPERAGLENEDIARANAIINVPVNADYASLNLAQSVLLLGYEWIRQKGGYDLARTDLAKTHWADTIEVTKLGDHYEAQLEEAGFFFPEEKAAGMKVNLRNLWSRMPMTQADIQVFHGIMRQMVRWKTRG